MVNSLYLYQNLEPQISKKITENTEKKKNFIYKAVVNRCSEVVLVNYIIQNFQIYKTPENPIRSTYLIMQNCQEGNIF